MERHDAELCLPQLRIRWALECLLPPQFLDKSIAGALLGICRKFVTDGCCDTQGLLARHSRVVILSHKYD